MNNTTEYDRAKMLLSAGILNNQKEIEVYEWLRLIVPDYGTKPFNKRFETWLNKQSIERFGTETIHNWGMNGESKSFPKIRFGFTKDTYSERYQLTFYYKGKGLGYNYETKTDHLRETNEHETLMGLHNAAEIVEWAMRVKDNRAEYLPKLMAQRDRLRSEIADHNDKISYAISDIVRVK
jgi:hypothetical protein